MDPTALGRYLRESREARELTLEDAVRALRIRRDILESFEQGEFNILDSTVRVRGMLRNYAHYLGLEEERVLQYYEAALDSKRRRRFGRRERHTELIAPKNITDTPPSLPTVAIPSPAATGNIGALLRNFAMILVSLAAIAVIIYVVMDTVGRDSTQEPIADVATVSGSVTMTATNTPTITPRATNVPATPDNFALGIVGVQVMLEMEQRSWVRILVDDSELYTGFLEPGDAATYEGNDSVTIVAANAAALDIVYNTIQQETFGTRGQQVELVFSTSGVAVTLGEGVTIPTEAPLTQDEAATPIGGTSEANLFTPTDQSDASSVSVENAPTSTATQSGVPTPTPLFPAGNNGETADTSNSEATPATDSASQDQARPGATMDSNVASATQETVPTSTPTSAAVLPIRATPANPTPTKTG